MVPLSEVFAVVGSMTTAEAYLAKTFVTDNESVNGPKLITTGLIDPFICKWGVEACRYLGEVYNRPRVSSTPELPEVLRRRVRESLRPKLLIAGLSNRIEACLDAAGECCGAVSTFSIFHPDDRIDALEDLCKWLNGDQATAFVRSQLGAASVGGGYMTIKKRVLLELPIPTRFAKQNEKGEAHVI
jgi:hypothetical protein